MNRRTVLPLVHVALLAACGGGEGASVRGSFRAEELSGDALHVRLAGASARVQVVDGGFVMEGVAPGAVALRVGRGDETVARMKLEGVPEGGAVELRGIRIDGESGLAFPAGVGLEGAETVVVNGIRYAAGPLPAELEAEGRVLAASRGGDALLVRPADAALPDLRVVVGPLTETTTPDGDPVPPEHLARGDTVTVAGSTRGGYLLASRIVAPRALALREAGAGEVAGDRGDDAAPSRPSPAPPRVRVESSDADESRDRDESRGRDESKGRDEAKGRDDGRGKGRGRGEERGRGKGKG